MVATASVEKGRLGAEVYIQPKSMDPKEAFRRLLNDRDSVEREAGFTMEWQELPEAKGSRVALYRTGVAFDNEADWAAQFEWLASHLEGLHRALAARIKAL